MLLENKTALKSETNDLYNSIMSYIGLNDRCYQLLKTTKYKGMAEYHKFTKHRWECLKEDLIEYVARQYAIYYDTTMIELYNYPMPSDIKTHIATWYKVAEGVVGETAEAMKAAVEAHDMILAKILERINMRALDDCKHLHDLVLRLKDSTDHDTMEVDHRLKEKYKGKFEARLYDRRYCKRAS